MIINSLYLGLFVFIKEHTFMKKNGEMMKLKRNASGHEKMTLGYTKHTSLWKTQNRILLTLEINLSPIPGKPMNRL